MTDVSESSIQDANVRASRLAVLYSADAYANIGRKMGRQQSGLGLLPALIRATRASHFPIAAARSENLVPLRALLERVRPDLGLHLWPLDKLDHLIGVDGLFVSDPNIVRWAEGRQWHRQSAKSWSLVGLTHTLSSLGVAEVLRKVPSSALQPWDALICTSRCARDAVQEVWNHSAEALSQRFGGQFSAWQHPQLPVIPLGCDFHYFECLASDYAMARHSLSLPQDQPVVLSVGRLELHAKAHPGVLFQALKRVCQRRATHLSRPCLLIVGTSQSQITSQAWQQAVERFSYWYDIRLIDGHSDQLTTLAWSAADLFVSVADSHQETFELTPVEAMARGLPVVATDWNGYCDTVIHGTTGCLILTTQPVWMHHTASLISVWGVCYMTRLWQI